MRWLFSKTAVIYARISRSVLGCFRMFYAQRSLDLSDTAWAQRAMFAFIALVSNFGAALPYPALAQAPITAVEVSEMTPVGFIQMLKDIAALGTFEKVDEVARLIGVELEQRGQRAWFPKSGGELPAWLSSVSAVVGPPLPGGYPVNWVKLRPNENKLCVSFDDVLAAFPGDYFVPLVISFPRAFTPEEAEVLSRREEASGKRRGRGPNLSTLFFPIYQPTEGRVQFDFSYQPCLLSGEVRILETADLPDGPTVRRVRRP